MSTSGLRFPWTRGSALRWARAKAQTGMTPYSAHALRQAAYAAWITVADPLLLLFLQENPPAPNDPEIVVDPAPETDFYVLSYGGRTNEKVLLEKATTLVAYLAEHDLPYSYDYFYAAGYDSPFRIFNRHNEIWIPARS